MLAREYITCATLALTACGGHVASETVGPPAAGNVQEAGSGTAPAPTPSVDAAPVDAGSQSVTASCDAISLGGVLPPTPYNGVRLFLRSVDLTAFFQDLAALNGLVVEAHGVDCSSGGVAAGDCTYDPRVAQVNGSDVHYSDALDRFVGPDGHPYVWLYVADRNEWVMVDRSVNAAVYEDVVDYEECQGAPNAGG